MLHNPTRFGLVVCDALAIPFTSSAQLYQRLFNQANTTSGKMELADVNAEGIVGVLYGDVAGADQEALEITEGKSSMIFDCTLDEQNLVKVGSIGHATLWKDSQTVIDTLITGEASAFTQPGTLSVITIHQAVDVAADRGRIVVIVGADGTGAGIMEEITLDGTASDTDVDGAVVFTTVCGAYMKDGSVLGAQSVIIEDDDPVTLCTISNATSEIGADIPGDTLEAYSNIVDVAGPNGNSTFVTLVGYPCATPTVLSAERLTLDGSSPSAAVTAAAMRQITRVCLGELTNALTGNVKTDADVDVPERIQGRVITPEDYLGTGAIQLI